MPDGLPRWGSFDCAAALDGARSAAETSAADQKYLTFHNVEITDSPTLAAVRPASHGQHRETTPGADLIAAAPAAIAILLLFVASWSHGAFPLRSWAPPAVFLLAAVAFAPHSRTSRPAMVFVAAFAGFALWSLASAIWSPRPGAAVEGGTRALLYAGLVAVPVCTLLTRRSAVLTATFLCACAGAIVAITAVGLVLGDAHARFLAGRLDDPVGYRNATAALFALCFWPLLAVGAHRRAHPLLRAACLALAVTALALAFLTQSRGVVLGFACGAVVALALGPDRLRRAWLAVLALAALAIASRTLLTPYEAFVASGRTVPVAVEEAVDGLAVLAVATFVVTLLGALFDGGLRVSARSEGRIAGAAAGALALVVVGAVTAGLAVAGDPVSLVDRKLHEFQQLDSPAPGETRLGSTSGQRYDLWRIAWRDFRAAPAFGAGEGGYTVRYYRERATDRNLSTPHSLVMSTLGELGLPGVLLLGGALLAAAIAIGGGWRHATSDERRWSSALAAAAAVALGQATVDWLWLIPGVMGLALVCLSTAVAIVALPRQVRLGRGRRGSWAVRAVAAGAAVVIALTFVSDAYVRSSRAAASPQRRLADARTAERLNPFALAPRYLQAGALETLGDAGGARQRLDGALDLEPESFVTLGLLGDLETRAGDRAAARRYYARALALNPRDTGLQKLAR